MTDLLSRYAESLFWFGRYSERTTCLARLLEVRASGQGGHIDCSMLGSLIGVAALQTSEYFGTGNAPQPLGSAHPRNAPYQAYRASDDYFIIAAGNDRLWAEVAEAVGIDFRRARLMVFLISSAALGVVGAYYAMYFGSISPQIFSLDTMLLLFAMMVIVQTVFFFSEPVPMPDCH